MLVLSRKQGESVEFAELGVTVSVVSLNKSKVQLGIQAPRQITVNRSEIAGRRDEARKTDGLESQRVFDELARIEAELAALAELADAKDRQVARQIATDSIERLAGIKRSLRFTTYQRSEARPISDFVKVRSDVLEHLRRDPQDESKCEEAITWSSAGGDRSRCVRQAPSGYAVVPASTAVTCSVA